MPARHVGREHSTDVAALATTGNENKRLSKQSGVTQKSNNATCCMDDDMNDF
jgi:hypothetical protein